MLGRLFTGRSLQGVLVAAILILAAWYLLFAPARFDRAKWLAADPSSRTRAYMVDDLVARYPMRRKTRNQIVNLLGPPTPTTLWPERELAYALGPPGGIGTDHEWLLFDLNVDSFVLDYEVVP
jgi:hypothetical protein